MIIRRYSGNLFSEFPQFFNWITTMICIGVFIGMSPLMSQTHNNYSLDVINYNVTIEPDIIKKEFDGLVVIDLISKNDQIVLECGRLIIKEVKGKEVKSFIQEKHKLIISFKENSLTKKEVEISYSGTANSGLKFFPKNNQVHTTYFTQEWMICHNIPSDRATIQTNLILPKDLTSIATGVLIENKKLDNNKTAHSWNLDVAAPPYTYGFAAGELNVGSNEQGGVILNYYSHSHPVEEINEIFESSGDILKFYEEKSGIPYFQKSYGQLLGVGNTSQEVCGFAILRENYGKQVLEDSTQINLSAHELAHQWWGNMITCESWNHFWLNEAMAVYMSSAYKEYRFGEEKYKEDINVYLKAYQEVKDKGQDKPLVFNNWKNPSSDDRSIVYYKGAYVLHLLKEELGKEEFWKGIKAYSQKYHMKSVNTKDFQLAMEESANRSLQPFFNEWIY